ncbi:hypothetical protein BY458DRAFT_520793 [Sporodiniella umbellata]|nr:hypothetical protein BY458DRAFT_520793 [Sporodiniella umbellata]
MNTYYLFCISVYLYNANSVIDDKRYPPEVVFRMFYFTKQLTFFAIVVSGTTFFFKRSFCLYTHVFPIYFTKKQSGIFATTIVFTIATIYCKKKTKLNEIKVL